MFPCPSSHRVLHPCKTFQDSCQILCFPLDPRLSVLVCAFITDCQGTILPFLKSLKDNDCMRGPLRLSKAMLCPCPRSLRTHLARCHLPYPSPDSPRSATAARVAISPPFSSSVPTLPPQRLLRPWQRRRRGRAPLVFLPPRSVST